MAQLSSADGARARRIDPLAAAAAVFFTLALLFGLYPAFRGGPTSIGSLLLPLGLAGVVFFATLAFRGGDDRSSDDIGAAALIDALGEPAALAAIDGRVLAGNAAWAAAVGEARRLPKSSRSGELFAAIAAARRGGIGVVDLRLAYTDRRAEVGAIDARRMLVRLVEPPPQPAPAVTPAAPSPEPATEAPRVVAGLDAFASAAPFGAALLHGDDPLEAVIDRVNEAFTGVSGADKAVGLRLADLIEPASWAEASGRIAAHRNGPFEVQLAHAKGRIAHLYVTRVGDGFVAYLLDVSEQKQVELELAQSQKIQAIGQLAGGVAHDFNNLLTALQLRLDELLLRHPVGDPSYEGLNEIRQTGVRAADLVRKLLAFSRKQTVQRVTLELGELISECEVLLRRLLREDVKLETNYGRNLPLVRADKSQLETAVMNLTVNARDAVHAQGGGVVRIRTARLSHAEAVKLGYGDDKAGPGEVALIEVADNGPGVPPEIRGKIFDPFFTTKPVGEGTGLGLATVYGIVRQADGWIHLESTPGRGAAFRIFLPVYIPDPSIDIAPTPAPANGHRQPARDLSGVGRILFVEDEDAVRVVAARLLRARGYEVIEAADGEEALALAEEHAGQIDLLISDVIMPGIDGPTLLKKARGFLGDAPVMFISGYAEAEFSDLLEDEKGVTFLPKPLDIKTLAERVKQQLQGG
jgi:two-component system cell cycle sensor histidine kinase/response regulator CckA